MTESAPAVLLAVLGESVVLVPEGIAMKVLLAAGALAQAETLWDAVNAAEEYGLPLLQFLIGRDSPESEDAAWSAFDDGQGFDGWAEFDVGTHPDTAGGRWAVPLLAPARWLPPHLRRNKRPRQPVLQFPAGRRQQLTSALQTAGWIVHEDEETVRCLLATVGLPEPP